MRLIPGQDWTWTYTRNTKSDKTYLSMNLVADNRKHYSFITQYEVADLKDLPAEGTSFCIQDGILLTAFQEGLYEIGIDQDAICLQMGLNALACARFHKETLPVGRFFINNGNMPHAKLGQVVSLYSIDGAIGDFIVLDDKQFDLVRVMLANQEFLYSGHHIKIGRMLRVPRNCLFTYRLLGNNSQNNYA